MEEAVEKMVYPTYERYKDSGVEWLGEIPEQWDVLKIKFLARIYNGDSLSESRKKEFESTDETEIPYVSTKDIHPTLSIADYKNGLRIPQQRHEFKRAPKGSFLLCIEGGSAGRKIAFLDEDVCFVNKLSCFVSNQKVCSKYLYYFVKSLGFQTQFNLAMTGLIGGVGNSLINNFLSIVPSLNEQSAIAAFLDRKTAQIDQAIARKERQIELLKEHRQILIHRAVTRGLDPKVPMKDSGVEWIGEIPAHWEIKKNKEIFEERKEPGSDDLPILSVSIHSAVSSGELDGEENIRGKIRIEDKSSYKKVEPNDVAYNMMRAWQGGIGCVSTKGMVSPAYVVAKPITKLNSDFFELQYRTALFIQQMDKASKGITDFRKRLYWAEFKDLFTILPSFEEQNEISSRIKLISARVDVALSKKGTEIEKLKELKTSLINAAVTGKIKITFEEAI